MAYLDIFIDEFAYFSLFPYIIYDHLKCVSPRHPVGYFSTEKINIGKKQKRPVTG
jgi:hypothetical protein